MGEKINRSLKNIDIEIKNLPESCYLIVLYTDESDKESTLFKSNYLMEKSIKFQEKIPSIPFIFEIEQFLMFRLLNSNQQEISSKSFKIANILQNSQNNVFEFVFNEKIKTQIIIRYSLYEDPTGHLDFYVNYSNMISYPTSIKIYINFEVASQHNEQQYKKLASKNGTIASQYLGRFRTNINFPKQPSDKNIRLSCYLQKETFLDLCCGTQHKIFEEAININELVSCSGNDLQYDVGANNHSIGKLILSDIKFSKMYNFFDYLTHGMEINLAIAIDFTASNGNPLEKNSLHYGTNENPSLYEKALLHISSILLEYDSDKQVPLWGFGGWIPHSTSSSLFNMVGYGKAEATGLNMIRDAYRNTLGIVQLSGPTNFSPIFSEMFNYINDSTENLKIKNKFFTLVILTDGQISDQHHTIDAIVEASYSFPLAIIIVGIGNGPFGLMETLDSDDSFLVDKKGRKMQSDIVQFVKFDPSMSAHLFKANVLEELPSQISRYYNLQEIAPQDLFNNSKEFAKVS